MMMLLQQDHEHEAMHVRPYALTATSSCACGVHVWLLFASSAQES